jgi:uncharacterized protein YbaR (Trm112 family)
MNLHSSLLDILACPITKDKLIYDHENQELISIRAELAFPIVDGIPMILVSEGKKVSKERLEKLQKNESV